MSSGSSSLATTAGMELLTDSYIPVFSCHPSEHREWRQRTRSTRSWTPRKPTEAVLNLMTSLQGQAWRQIEPMVDELLAKEDAFDLILAELDKMFK